MTTANPHTAFGRRAARRLLGLLLALVCLGAGARANGESVPSALGLYTPLNETQTAEEEDAVRAVLALLVQDDMTDGEKATVLHDWLVLNCRYNLTFYRDMSYGALVEGQATCRGYARAYVRLAQALGLASEYSFSEELVHAWTLTELDGSYYYIDPTWDDNHYERIGTVSHRHFFFSTEDERSFSHYGGDSSIYAEGGPYEQAPWRSAVTRVIFEGEWAYYLDGEFRLIRCRRDSWETEVLFQSDERWPGFTELSGDPAICSGLVLMRGRLWFNTPSAIVSVDLTGGDLRREFELAEDAEGWICGIDVRRSRLVYSLAEEAGTLQFSVLESGIYAWDAWGCEASLKEVLAAVLSDGR